MNETYQTILRFLRPTVQWFHDDFTFILPTLAFENKRTAFCLACGFGRWHAEIIWRKRT